MALYLQIKLLIKTHPLTQHLKIRLQIPQMYLIQLKKLKIHLCHIMIQVLLPHQIIQIQTRLETQLQSFKMKREHTSILPHPNHLKNQQKDQMKTLKLNQK